MAEYEHVDLMSPCVK